MEKVYKVRTHVQHIATQDIFQIIRRRGMFNCHYILALKHTQNKYDKQWPSKTNWLSGENLATYYRVLNSKSVRVLYGRTQI